MGPGRRKECPNEQERVHRLAPVWHAGRPRHCPDASVPHDGFIVWRRPGGIGVTEDQPGVRAASGEDGRRTVPRNSPPRSCLMVSVTRVARVQRPCISDCPDRGEHGPPARRSRGAQRRTRGCQGRHPRRRMGGRRGEPSAIPEASEDEGKPTNSHRQPTGPRRSRTGDQRGAGSSARARPAGSCSPPSLPIPDWLSARSRLDHPCMEALDEWARASTRTSPDPVP